MHHKDRVSSRIDFGDSTMQDELQKHANRNAERDLQPPNGTTGNCHNPTNSVSKLGGNPNDEFGGTRVFCGNANGNRQVQSYQASGSH